VEAKVSFHKGRHSAEPPLLLKTNGSRAPCQSKKRNERNKAGGWKGRIAQRRRDDFSGGERETRFGFRGAGEEGGARSVERGQSQEIRALNGVKGRVAWVGRGVKRTRAKKPKLASNLTQGGKHSSHFDGLGKWKPSSLGKRWVLHITKRKGD